MVYVIIVLAVLARFIPHVHNFSPVYGALLLGGAHLKKRDSVWFPVFLLGVSDIVLTNLIYGMNIGWAELVQMAAFASIAMTGWILRQRFTPFRFGLPFFPEPTPFYLFTQFAFLLGFTTY